MWGSVVSGVPTGAVTGPCGDIFARRLSSSRTGSSASSPARIARRMSPSVTVAIRWLSASRTMAMPLPFRSIHEITLRIVLLSETTNAEKSVVTLSSIKRFCGHTDHSGSGGHVLCYHRARPNSNLVADFKILQDRGAGPDQTARTHFDAAGHVDAGIEHATVGDTHVVAVGAV